MYYLVSMFYFEYYVLLYSTYVVLLTQNLGGVGGLVEFF